MEGAWEEDVARAVHVPILAPRLHRHQCRVVCSHQGRAVILNGRTTTRLSGIARAINLAQQGSAYMHLPLRTTEHPLTPITTHAKPMPTTWHESWLSQAPYTVFRLRPDALQ